MSDDGRGGTAGGSAGDGQDRVSRAMLACPRTGFLRRHERRRAHEDRPLPIGHGQTSSQPSTVARMLRELDVPVGARVLDVGSGSGWTTALLAHLVGPRGVVVGVELEPELVAWGGANVAATDQPWARVLPARPGALGWPEEAPFDRVLVSAEASELPTALVEQLAVAGRMVVPVRGEMLTIDRTGSADGTAAAGDTGTAPSGGPGDAGTTAPGITVRRHGTYRFVPLR